MNHLTIGLAFLCNALANIVGQSSSSFDGNRSNLSNCSLGILSVRPWSQSFFLQGGEYFEFTLFTRLCRPSLTLHLLYFQRNNPSATLELADQTIVGSCRMSGNALALCQAPDISALFPALPVGARFNVEKYGELNNCRHVADEARLCYQLKNGPDDIHILGANRLSSYPASLREKAFEGLRKRTTLFYYASPVIGRVTLLDSEKYDYPDRIQIQGRGFQAEMYAFSSRYSLLLVNRQITCSLVNNGHGTASTGIVTDPASAYNKLLDEKLVCQFDPPKLIDELKKKFGPAYLEANPEAKADLVITNGNWRYNTTVMYPHSRWAPMPVARGDKSSIPVEHIVAIIVPVCFSFFAAAVCIFLLFLRYSPKALKTAQQCENKFPGFRGVFITKDDIRLKALESKAASRSRQTDFPVAKRSTQHEYIFR